MAIQPHPRARGYPAKITPRNATDPTTSQTRESRLQTPAGGGRAHHGHGDGPPQALRQRAPPPAALPHHAALPLGTPPPASCFIFVARQSSVLIFHPPTPSKELKKRFMARCRFVFSFFLIWFALLACAGVPAGDGGEIRSHRMF
jgi:hypothetical protein